MSNAVTTEIQPGALIVRFTRPEGRNPLSISVLSELESILDSIPAVSKLIFTGSDGVFASGADLREVARLSSDEAGAFACRGQVLMDRIAKLSVLTIAAINGPCFGGALDLALVCDRRVAAPDAKFCHPGAGLGIITGWGGTQRLPRIVGEAKALEMLFTAEPIDADEAKRIGLIDTIAADALHAALNF